MTTSVRMTPEQERVIKQAAQLDHRSVNNVIVSAAVRAAEALLLAHQGSGGRPLPSGA